VTRTRADGMTLLELLIATALVAVAMLVVAQAFAAGIRVWSRASQLAGNYADSVIALETFQRDVRNTISCRLNAFRGGEVWLEIPSLIVGAGIDDQPGLIRYDFDVAGQKLDRVLKPCDVLVPGVMRRETLAGGVKEISFLYAERGESSGSALVWGRTWEGRTNNPAAVKVIWRGQQGEELFEFERTVSLPCK
jgi:prepilin-type N-terminal cleavage/methylation domain-containing protein